MEFFTSPKRHALKNEPGLRTNVFAESAQNSTFTTCSPASLFQPFSHLSTNNDNSCSVASVESNFRSRTSIAGASRLRSRSKLAINVTATNNNLDLKLDSETLPPALTSLRARPSNYEDLHTLTAYGELPLTKLSDPVPPLSQRSPPPSSSVRRLFEVAKPPAITKRRRYTVATERPSVSPNKENVRPSNDGNGPVNGSFPGEARERASSSATHGMEKPTPRPSTIRASSLPCNSPSGCPDSELPTEPSGTRTLFNLKSSSKTSYLSSVPSTPSSPLTSSVLSKRSPIPSASHGTNVNVRYVPYFPYMILEPAAASNSLSSCSSTPSESDQQNVGVLSRVKYRVVKVSAEDNEDLILKEEEEI